MGAPCDSIPSPSDSRSRRHVSGPLHRFPWVLLLRPAGTGVLPLSLLPAELASALKPARLFFATFWATPVLLDTCRRPTCRSSRRRPTEVIVAHQVHSTPRDHHSGRPPSRKRLTTPRTGRASGPRSPVAWASVSPHSHAQPTTAQGCPPRSRAPARPSSRPRPRQPSRSPDAQRSHEDRPAPMLASSSTTVRSQFGRRGKARARMTHIREHSAGTDEDVPTELHPVPHARVRLDARAIADDGPLRDEAEGSDDDVAAEFGAVRDDARRVDPRRGDGARAALHDRTIC